MTNLLDHVVVVTLVTLSTLFVLYSLGPARTKKWMLSQVARYFGLRVLLWVMPKQGGCSGCDAATPGASVAGKLNKDWKKTQR